MRLLAYALEEALINLRRGGRSVVMSVGTIAVAFLTLGLFLLVAANLQSVVDRWAAAAEMSVYLRDDAGEARRQQLETELAAHPAVLAVEYVSKDAALARFKADFPELADVTEGDAANPFPASLEVRLRPDPAAAGAADAMAELLAAREGVADVRYDRQWLGRLLGVINGVRLTGMAVAAVLVLGAAFTVAAVVRLSLLARQEEVEIMKLVGAPFGFMRGPSIAEGTLLGGFGAALSLLLLWGVFAGVRDRLGDVAAGFVDVQELQFLGAGEAVLLVVAGFFVGGVTGLIASRSLR